VPLSQMVAQQEEQCVSSPLHTRGRPTMNASTSMAELLGVPPPQAMMLMVSGDSVLVGLPNNVQPELLDCLKFI